VLSQLKRIARALWSNPPTHGARIAAEVVGDAAMFEEWKGEMAGEGPHGAALVGVEGLDLVDDCCEGLWVCHVLGVSKLVTAGWVWGG
jgi:hypothetical protein